MKKKKRLPETSAENYVRLLSRDSKVWSLELHRFHCLRRALGSCVMQYPRYSFSGIGEGVS